MSVAVLYEVPRTSTDLSRWSFVHMTHHRDIIRVILEQKNQTLSEYTLDPFNPSSSDFETWLYQHQIMHDQIEAVLGLRVSSFDFTDVDWQDPEGLVDWISTHAQEHLQMATLLGVD